MKTTGLCKVAALILSLAATQVSFAAGRSSGGFHGGFGGFHSFSGGRPAFRGGGFTGNRFAFGSRPTFGRPAYVQRPGAGRFVQRSSAARFAQHAPATNSRSSSARPTGPQIAPAGAHVYARRDGNWHRDWDRRSAHFSNGRWWAWDGGLWIGLEAGFYPWDYYPYYAYDYYPYDYYPGYYADVEPYYSNQGVSKDVPAPDQNVKAVQAELAREGFYTGPVDGLYGRSTRDAVARFQAARKVAVTGTLTRKTLESLGVAQGSAS